MTISFFTCQLSLTRTFNCTLSVVSVAQLPRLPLNRVNFGLVQVSGQMSLALV